jgi:FeS assembly SUF system protein
MDAPTDAERDVIRDLAVDAIKTVFDPEIPVNIYELGLIYDVKVQDTRVVEIEMTLTSPNCPAAQSLPSEVELKVGAVEGTSGVVVDIVWDPPWDPSRMSEAAQLELNM